MRGAAPAILSVGARGLRLAPAAPGGRRTRSQRVRHLPHPPPSPCRRARRGRGSGERRPPGLPPLGRARGLSVGRALRSPLPLRGHPPPLGPTAVARAVGRPGRPSPGPLIARPRLPGYQRRRRGLRDSGPPTRLP